EDAVVPVGEALAFIATAEEATVSAKQPTPSTDSIKATPVARRMAAEHKVELEKIKGTGDGGTITKEDLAAYISNSQPRPQSDSAEPVRASPAARRVARELGIDLATLTGTGPGGRVTEEDVRRAAQPQAATRSPEPVTIEPIPQPKVEPMVSGIPITSTMPVRGIRQVIAERMTLSFQTTPHFYLTVELDATALLDMQRRLKAKASEAEPPVTVTDLLVKFVATALAEHPFANAGWKDGTIEFYGQVNIGIATATEQGLIVPVIRGAEHLNLRGIANARQELVNRARTGKLTLRDVSDGTFTISNLGMYGIDLFSGIINPPQSALLAVGRIKDRPYGVNGEIRLRP